MTTTDQKRLLIVCRKPPYGNILARESLDVILAASAFELSLAILFTDDGVWQLLNYQDTSLLGIKNHVKMMSALPMYDIHEIYVNSDAMENRQILSSQLILPATLLGDGQISDFMAQFDSLLSF